MDGEVTKASVQGSALVCLLLMLFSCGHRERSETPENTEAILDSADFLARTHCSSCHLFPTPDLLDKNTWADQALPSMAHRFGIYRDRSRDSLIEKGMAGRIVESANVFPDRQIISDKAWNTIVSYYNEHAPERLLFTEDSAGDYSKAFIAKIPGLKIPRPSISALAYDPIRRQFFVADCSRNDYTSVLILDSNFKPLTTLGLPHPVSNLTVRSDTLYILMMGHFVPSDEPAGQLLKAIRNEHGEYIGYKMMLKGLKRPVDVAFNDLDQDGDDDIVICEFGNHTGSVSLFVKEGKNNYLKKVLSNVPGAVKVIVEDIDHDLKKDIIVLMAQGDEGVDIYFNKGDARFVRERVLRFPPVYGCSSIALADFNNDGSMDLILTNGDNADASRILKPYHGIRIYLNNGSTHFNESYFYPMPGAYQALARDFDHDGDLDVAAIAFFPDFNRSPQKGFVYLENSSENNVIQFSPGIVKQTDRGRWITFIHSDADQDGFDELLLGSFTGMEISGDFDRFEKFDLPLIVLENIAGGY